MSSKLVVNYNSHEEDNPTIFLKNDIGIKSSSRKGKRVVGILCFKLPKSSKISTSKLLRQLEAKVARVLRFVSINMRSSRKVSSSSSSSSRLARSRSLTESIESHRAEDIEDCIQFLNSSSSSLWRSNSASVCS